MGKGHECDAEKQCVDEAIHPLGNQVHRLKQAIDARADDDRHNSPDDRHTQCGESPLLARGTV